MAGIEEKLCLEKLGFAPVNLHSKGVDEIRPYVAYSDCKILDTEVVLDNDAQRSWRLSRFYQSNPTPITLPPPTLRTELEVLGAIEQPVSVEADATNCASGRGLLCVCYNRAYVNAVVRKKSSLTNLGSSPYQVRSSRDATEKFINEGTYAGRTCTYFPDDKNDKFYYSIKETCDLIWKCVGKLEGLTIVAGSTGTGKSQIVRGLIFNSIKNDLKNLQNKLNKDKTQTSSLKRTHLLTIENPIEEYLFEDDSGKPLDPNRLASDIGLDYTPRQMPDDTPSLEQALLRDALRQTPTLVYVGEIREPDEFRTVLKFAETGHPIIVTMHAGSLREAFQRVLSAADAETPADRAQIASRLGAVIHLARLDNKITKGGANDEKKLTLPTVWKSTSTGVSNLIADGLSSIVPNEFINTPYCFGRASFLKNVANDVAKGVADKAANDRFRTSFNAVRSEAVKLDMGRG